jgi:hypothetical protein
MAAKVSALGFLSVSSRIDPVISLGDGMGLRIAERPRP